jgi:hypothetical protein
MRLTGFIRMRKKRSAGPDVPPKKRIFTSPRLRTQGWIRANSGDEESPRTLHPTLSPQERLSYSHILPSDCGADSVG